MAFGSFERIQSERGRWSVVWSIHNHPREILLFIFISIHLFFAWITKNKNAQGVVLFLRIKRYQVFMQSFHHNFERVDEPLEAPMVAHAATNKRKSAASPRRGSVRHEPLLKQVQQSHHPHTAAAAAAAAANIAANIANTAAPNVNQHASNWRSKSNQTITHQICFKFNIDLRMSREMYFTK